MSELIVYKLSLDVSYPGCEKQINLIHGETGSRILQITLTDGSSVLNLNPVTDMAVIRGVKADKTIVYNSAKIKDSGIIEYAFTEQDTAVAGDGYYEVQIIRTEEERSRVLYSALFKVHVSETLYQDEKITSLNEYTALTEAVTAARKAEENMYIEYEPDITWETGGGVTATVTSISNEIYCDKITIKQTAGNYVYITLTEWDSNGNQVNKLDTNSGIPFDEFFSYQVQEEGNYIRLQVSHLYSVTCPEGLNVKYYLYHKRYFKDTYVPQERQVAGYSLETDITPAQIIEKITKDSNAVPILASYISNIAQGNISIHNTDSEAHQDIRDLIETCATLEQLAIIESIAKGAQKAESFVNYATLVDILNSYDGTELIMGQSIYIVTTGVPDVWVCGIAEKYESFTYTTDEDFASKLKDGYVKVGHYVLAELETKKINLEDYVPNTRTIADLDLADNITAYELANALINTSGSAMSLVQFVQTQVNNNSTVKSNTAASHSHANKEFLDTLTEEVMTGKLSVAQGADYKNRVMAVGLTGNIEPIDANTLGSIITQVLTNGGSWYSTLIPWLNSHCGSKSQEDANTQAIEKLKSKDEWQLLHQYTLGEVKSVLMDFDTFDFANQYKEIRIQFNGACSANNVPIYFYFNNINNLCNMANCTSTESNRYDWIIKTDKYYATTVDFNIATELKRISTSLGVTSIFNHKADWIEKVEDITGIRMVVQNGATFPAALRVSIFGKEA